MSGLSLPAGELAKSANVAPQTASEHLSRLLQGKLLSAEIQGRHRYYRLASSQVATIIEALALIAPQTNDPVRQTTPLNNPFRFARTCYNHLAGTLAVQIAEALQEGGLLAPARDNDYALTNQGRVWCEEWGIGLEQIKSGRGAFARACLDWTERRHHLAGRLGTALLQRLFELKWVVRIDKTRIVRVTTRGQEHLHQLFGIEFKS